MNHFTYMTTCSVTGRFYVGKHSTRNLDDGYIGSGKLLRASVRKHGKSEHVRVIVEFFNSLDELNDAERLLVEAHISDPMCMNLGAGGRGGTTFRSVESRMKQSLSRRGKSYPKAKGQVSPMKGRHHKPESIEKLKRNHWKGYLHDYRERNP